MDVNQLFAMNNGFIGGSNGQQGGGGYLLGLIPSMEGMFSSYDMSNSSIEAALARILPIGKINLADMFNPSKRGNGLLDKLFRILQLDKIRGGGFFSPPKRNLHEYEGLASGHGGGHSGGHGGGNGFVPMETPGMQGGGERGV